ncbi:MAG: hypothetical protein PHR77_16020 [Kiritimatiellae bacterium]|nr:hypothetical protein [Kiritimatiellia bacterium]MDD5523317.1 hypothetical protein [Kiritimatiellia bacterium]
MKRTFLVVATLLLSSMVELHAAEFKAGTAIIDITPTNLPVLVNGGMTSRSVNKIKTPIHARAIALADGKQQIAIVVVDSCMMPRPLLDEAKALAEKRTGIPANRMLISAVHTHSTPSSMGCLGTDADEAYVPFLRDKLVEAIVAAQAALEPARVGFAKGNAAEFTALRQWIRRPDRVVEDPFGNMTVRANMHSGSNWDNATGEAGPEDPDLALISIQARDGRPFAVLGNFSMHYFGDRDISADYYGLFCEGLKQRIAPEAVPGKAPFVGIMSHGCSGDIWRRDYTRPASEWNAKLTIEEYAKGLVDIAMKAYQGIRYRDDVDLAMDERRMTLNYRVPDKQRLEWAQRIVDGMSNRLAKTTTEVYAREQIILHERQKTEIVAQALRIGEIGIATTPCETYAITGLKIKAASPLAHNMVIELANGGDGYIPPPEQYPFGGYNTWPARSAGLEVMAEPKITEAIIGMLEKISARPRREWKLNKGPATSAILKAKPVAYWRMNEFTGPHASDASGNGHDAVYESAITYYLEGPCSTHFCGSDEINRAPHFVGGRLRARLTDLGNSYSVSMWLWNGMPNDGRDVSGWLFSRNCDNGLGAYGDHLGIGGKSAHTGRLIFFHGDDVTTAVAGKTVIPRWQWQHVIFVRDGQTVRVYLNGQLDMETKAAADFPAGFDQYFFGGRSDNDSNWEGRLDEIAIFNRALTARNVSRLVVK